jgi:hypothetical protein
MAGKSAGPKLVVLLPFDRTDGWPAKNVEFAPGDSWDSDHPDTPKYLEWGLVGEDVPAPAGSSQPGKSDEGAE